MILTLRVVEFVAHGPIVTDRVGKNLAIVIKATRRNRLLHLLGLHSFALFFIPERECPIRASSSHRSMLWVKLDGIHRGRMMTFDFKVVLRKPRRGKIISKVDN